MNYTEKEKEYFNNKLSQVIYNPNRFKVLIGEDRFLFGIVSAGDSEAPFGRLMQYKTLYDTLMRKILIPISGSARSLLCMIQV